jgi:hypothetical protein
VRFGHETTFGLQDFVINGINNTGMEFKPGEKPYLALLDKQKAVTKVPLSKIARLDFKVVGEDNKGQGQGAPRPCPLYMVKATLFKGKPVFGIVDIDNAGGPLATGHGEWKARMCGVDRPYWEALKSVDFNTPILKSSPKNETFDVPGLKKQPVKTASKKKKKKPSKSKKVARRKPADSD